MEDREAAAKELPKILEVLEEVAREELEQERFDICGRAFMIASAILADFDSIANEQKDPKVAQDITEYCTTHVNMLRSSPTPKISQEDKLRALIISLSIGKVRWRRVWLIVLPPTLKSWSVFLFA